MHQSAASRAPARTRRTSFPARGPRQRSRDRCQTSTFTYNPASQIGSVTRTNDTYAWTGHGLGSTASVANGLNQLTSIGGATVTHDARGNVTLDPTTGKWLVYESQNELKGGLGLGIGYDALLRPIDTNVNGAGWKQFLYDGIQIVAELQPGLGITGRYVWGDGPDELLVDYVGSGTSNRRWAHTDERGSIIALSDGAGNATINRYDEYGKPAATNLGRFQYTGQMWLSDVGLYHYKARAYSPTMGGRFYQTDPIGYQAGPNLYPYVGNDPVNLTDPSGTYAAPTELSNETEEFRGSGRVWDWMGIEATHVGGRLDAAVLNRAYDAWAILSRLSSQSGDGGAVCVRYCNAPPSGNANDQGEIVNYPSPVYAQLIPRPNVGPPPSIFFSRPPIFIPRPSVPFPRGTGRPGPDFEWRGNGPPGSPEGSWFNPRTQEVIRPDLNHPRPIGPHHDYRAPNGQWFRWFGPGNMAPKSIAPVGA